MTRQKEEVAGADGVFLQVDLVNLGPEGVEVVLQTLYARFPTEVVNFVTGTQQFHEKEVVQAYLDALLTELGLLRFKTSPSAFVIATRLRLWLDQPEDAAEQLRNWLVWAENPQEACQILLEEIPGLERRPHLQQFARALQKAFGRDPSVKGLRVLVGRLDLPELFASPVLRLLAKTYIPDKYSGQELAEILWQMTVDAAMTADFARAFRIKFKKISRQVDDDELSGLASVLIEACQEREASQEFQGIVEAVVNLLGIDQGAVRNSAFRVIVGAQLNGLQVDAGNGVVEKAQLIADQLMQELEPLAAQGDAVLRRHLEEKYLTSRADWAVRAENWLMPRLLACLD